MKETGPIALTPREARWIATKPRQELEQSQVELICRRALGSAGPRAISPLAGGLRNTNFKIALAGPCEAVVLRLYEHDPVLCQKEIDLLRLVGASVPVPELIYGEPRGSDGLPPFMLTRFVEGISVRDLRLTADKTALAEAGYAVGRTAAVLGGFSFSKPGWISAGPTVTTPLLEGRDPAPRFVDLCVDSPRIRERVPVELCRRLRQLMWSYAPQLARQDELAKTIR
jgi:hypothetical protein